uniref:Uncharacterized protein n=1 Tax=Timema poppense TaxID=170557 RepID=A0A7R9DFT2_TIMPO|nr:unnamed protein product [Timema poppensis]
MPPKFRVLNLPESSVCPWSKGSKSPSHWLLTRAALRSFLSRGKVVSKSGSLEISLSNAQLFATTRGNKSFPRSYHKVWPALLVDQQQSTDPPRWPSGLKRYSRSRLDCRLRGDQEPALREQQCSLYLAVSPSSPPPPMCACAQQSNTTSLAQ